MIQTMIRFIFRHREEIDRMHNDLQKAKNRLEEKVSNIAVKQASVPL